MSKKEFQADYNELFERYQQVTLDLAMKRQQADGLMLQVKAIQADYNEYIRKLESAAESAITRITELEDTCKNNGYQAGYDYATEKASKRIAELEAENHRRYADLEDEKRHCAAGYDNGRTDGRKQSRKELQETLSKIQKDLGL